MESVILRQWFPKCGLYDSATVSLNFLNPPWPPLRSLNQTLGTELSRLCFNKPAKHLGRTFTLEDQGPRLFKTSQVISVALTEEISSHLKSPTTRPESVSGESNLPHN